VPRPLTAWSRRSIVVWSPERRRQVKTMRKFHDRASLMRKAISLTSAGLLMADFLCLCCAVQARPLVPAERRYDYYEGALPNCADPQVFERIQSHFNEREAEFWKSGLVIVGFDAPREIGLRSNGLDYIPRRYCVARVLLNNQSAREVSYSIVEDQGIIGFSFGVDWCVSGLDRNYADAPNCRMARP
jgi:hypothetical protein